MVRKRTTLDPVLTFISKQTKIVLMCRADRRSLRQGSFRVDETSHTDLAHIMRYMSAVRNVGVGLILVSCLGTSAGENASDSTILGSCPARLEGWVGDYELDIRQQYALAYRQRGDEQVYLLMTKSIATHGCREISTRKIVAILRLPILEPGEWHAVVFDCVDATKKQLKAGQPVIGIFRSKGLSAPRIAWTIDTSKRAFRQISGIRCEKF